MYLHVTWLFALSQSADLCGSDWSICPGFVQLESGAGWPFNNRKVTKRDKDAKATASKVPGLRCKYNRTIIKGASPLSSLK